MPDLRERVTLAGLKVQAERLAAVEAAVTTDELEQADAYWQAMAVIADDPVFVSAFEMGGDSDG